MGRYGEIRVRVAAPLARRGGGLGEEVLAPREVCTNGVCGGERRTVGRGAQRPLERLERLERVGAAGEGPARLAQHERVARFERHVDPRPPPGAGDAREPLKDGRPEEALVCLRGGGAKERLDAVENAVAGGGGGGDAGGCGAVDAPEVASPPRRRVERRVERAGGG